MGTKVYYKQGKEIIDIIVRDDAGRKIGFFRANLHDTDEIKRIFKVLKYKFDLNIDEEGFFDF